MKLFKILLQSSMVRHQHKCNTFNRSFFILKKKNYSLTFQVLKFHGYFKSTVHESPDEHHRVRRIDLFYYLEDDSIAVVEPHDENSGLPQGNLSGK